MQVYEFEKLFFDNDVIDIKLYVISFIQNKLW